MKRQFEQHRRKDRIRWNITGAVIFLLILAVVGMGLQLFGHGKQKPSEWFTKSDKQVETTVDGDVQTTNTIYTVLSII